MNKTKRRTRRVTISLPEELLRAADEVGALELRNRSELVREALRRYVARVPVDEATPEELAAMERGKAQIARGEYVTLDELLHDLGTDRRKGRAKKSQTVSG